jgi:AcrR family transcriptional regulator
VGTARILEEAARLFIGQGYGRTTVEQIAAASDYTKGAVYFYFSSKAGLLNSLVDKIESCAILPAIAAAEAAADPLARLVAFLHAEAVVGTSSADYMLLAITMTIELNVVEDPVGKRLAGLMNRLSELLEDIVISGQSLGAFRTDLDPKELASYLMAVNTGCFIESRRRSNDPAGPEFVYAMRNMILDGIVSREADDRQITREA